MLHTCEFCGSQYCPRAQVKNPRACSKPECQAARQRANELEWHRKNPDRYGKEYYKRWRKNAHKRRLDLQKSLTKALKVGLSLNGSLDHELQAMTGLVSDFLDSLGIRQINKFCTA